MSKSSGDCAINCLLSATQFDQNTDKVGVSKLLSQANPDGKMVYSEPSERGVLYLENSSEAAIAEYANKLNQNFSDLNAKGRYDSHITFKLNGDLKKVIQSTKSGGATFDINSGMYLGTTVSNGPYVISKEPAIQNYSDIMKARIPLRIEDFDSKSKSRSANF